MNFVDFNALTRRQTMEINLKEDFNLGRSLYFVTLLVGYQEGRLLCKRVCWNTQWFVFPLMK